MEQLSKDLLERLDLLASRLGVTLDVLWGSCVKQANVEGWYAVFWVIFCPFILYVMYKVINKYWAEIVKEDAEGVVIGLSMVVYVVLMIVFIISAADTKMLINPEYYAFKEIAKLIN